jgi:hypothetical protein
MHFGALALAAAAVTTLVFVYFTGTYPKLQVERGLSAFKFKTDELEDDITTLPSLSDGRASEGTNGKSMNHRVSGFTESPWGMKTRLYVESTETLNSRQWEKITLCAFAFIPAGELRGNGVVDEGGGKCAVVDPRSCIELDWYVFPLLRDSDPVLKHSFDQIPVVERPEPLQQRQAVTRTSTLLLALQ